MELLQELTQRRKRAHAKFLKLNSKTYKSFLELEKATFCDGELSAKVKELIAVGISAAVNCESCIQWHTEYAMKAGASEDEIMEALEVAMEIGGGRAVATARIAVEVMQSISEKDYESAQY
ncbi:MAG TPA: carboxymuconolactone decarboxylase family protein [Ignavibacteriaceae bacterium]|nr:carboxymuconolactone decarboxylase family protein [Ignavibacteriaceae bacterium]